MKDNGKIAGCNPEEEFHMISGAAEVYCEPPIIIESTVHQEGFRLVLEINVPKAQKRIIKAKNDDGKPRLYFRKNDQTIEVNKILKKVWLHEDHLTKRPSVFDEHALSFLKVFSEEPVSLSKVYRDAGVDKKSVDDLLPKFIFWGLVEMNFEPTRVSYRLA